MRTIPDTVIILREELFVTGCQEKANKCVFAVEKVSAPPIVEDTQQLFWQSVQIYQSLSYPWPKVLTQFEKQRKQTMEMKQFSVLAKIGFFKVAHIAFVFCICFLTQHLFYKSNWP